jgi:hypothetical protein
MQCPQTVLTQSRGMLNPPPPSHLRTRESNPPLVPSTSHIFWALYFAMLICYVILFAPSVSVSVDYVFFHFLFHYRRGGAAAQHPAKASSDNLLSFHFLTLIRCTRTLPGARASTEVQGKAEEQAEAEKRKNKRQYPLLLLQLPLHLVLPHSTPTRPSARLRHSSTQ